MASQRDTIRIHTYEGDTDVDISRFKDLIDTPEVQRLRRVNQISYADYIYPDATNTRFSHSLGVYHGAGESNSVLSLDESSSRLNCAYGLTHDIGHGPESHEWEDVVKDLAGIGHMQKGLERIRSRSMAGALEKTGVRPEDLEGMHLRENPLHKIVSSKVGLDKLDYIERDRHFSAKGVKLDIKRIINNMVFDGKNYGIAERARDDVKSFLDAMVSAYYEIYWVKSLQIARTMLSRAIYYSILDGAIDMDKGWDMDDYELIYRMRNSSSETPREIMGRLDSRNKLKAAGVAKLHGCREYEPIKGKPVHVECISRVEREEFGKKCGNIRGLAELEERLAAEFGLKKGELMLSIPPTLEVSNSGLDVLIYREGSREDPSDSGFRTVYDVFPGLREHLVTQTDNQYAIRMVVDGDSRERVYGILKKEGMKGFLLH